jgi:hypothetical protein
MLYPKILQSTFSIFLFENQNCLNIKSTTVKTNEFIYKIERDDAIGNTGKDDATAEKMMQYNRKDVTTK